LQTLPLVLIPLWQAIHASPRRDRGWFGIALLLYVGAKVAELLDHQLAAQLGWMSGRTLKHLLATAAAAVLVGRLGQRLREVGDAKGCFDPNQPRPAASGQLVAN